MEKVSHLEVYVRKSGIVIVVSGKSKGRTGEALKVNSKTGEIIVQGVSIVRKHQKPTRANAQGGIIEREGAIYSPKVMLYCIEYKNTTRTGNKILGDGAKVRVCKKCGETL